MAIILAGFTTEFCPLSQKQPEHLKLIPPGFEKFKCLSWGGESERNLHISHRKLYFFIFSKKNFFAGFCSISAGFPLGFLCKAKLRKNIIKYMLHLFFSSFASFYPILTLIPYFFRFFFEFFKNVDVLPKKDIYCLFWAG